MAITRDLNYEIRDSGRVDSVCCGHLTFANSFVESLATGQEYSVDTVTDNLLKTDLSF